MWIMLCVCLGLVGCGSDSESTSTDGLKAPSNLKAEPLERASHLTWTDNSDEAEFMIERKSGSADWTTIGTVPFDTTQYHDANVDPTLSYTYRVMPMSKDGKHGPASNEASCMPLAAAAGAAGSGHEGH
jgi:hypothetical protein